MGPAWRSSTESTLYHLVRRVSPCPDRRPRPSRQGRAAAWQGLVGWLVGNDSVHGTWQEEEEEEEDTGEGEGGARYRPKQTGRKKQVAPDKTYITK